MLTYVESLYNETWPCMLQHPNVYSKWRQSMNSGRCCATRAMVVEQYKTFMKWLAPFTLKMNRWPVEVIDTWKCPCHLNMLLTTVLGSDIQPVRIDKSQSITQEIDVWLHPVRNTLRPPFYSRNLNSILFQESWFILIQYHWNTVAMLT